MAQPQANSEWDETQLQAALAHLKTLHIKVRNLRETIPRMLEPLTQRHPSPEAMLRQFMNAVEQAQQDVKEFTDLMRDGNSAEIFARVEKSQLENGAGVKPWRHKEFPDWYTMDGE